jgi:hypothetical protein
VQLGEPWRGVGGRTVGNAVRHFRVIHSATPRNLWFAIGFHAATDYAETFIDSVPDSGMLASAHLLNSNLHGPCWLTGGTIGPEGSVVDFALLLAAFFVVAVIFPE